MKNKLVLDEQYSQYEFLAGCDEAGRGCLLGPVVASSVILPKDFYSPLINDSKKLSEKQREEAFKIVKDSLPASLIYFKEQHKETELYSEDLY